jgi:hypothetical protein
MPHAFGPWSKQMTISRFLSTLSVDFRLCFMSSFRCLFLPTESGHDCFSPTAYRHSPSRRKYSAGQNYMNGYATSRKVAGSIPDEVIAFVNKPNPSSRTMALGSTQTLTEMSIRNLPGSKGRSAREADLTAICEPIVYKMREPRCLTTL